MADFSLFDFMTLSVPEEFCMVLLVWIMLGNKEVSGFSRVIIATITAAIAFYIMHIIFIPNVAFIGITQLFSLFLIVLLVYKTSFLRAVFASLLSAIAVTVVQGGVMGLGYVITGIEYDSLPPGSIAKILYVFIECAIVGLLSSVLYKSGMKLINFKKSKPDEYSTNKMRYMVLQLTFSFIVVLINYKVFYFNMDKLTTATDKMLIILNFAVIIVFTGLTVRTAFKMGDKILKKEGMKRQFDRREFAQNIDYLCRLMELKQYEEVDNILKSMKYEVNPGCIDDHEPINLRGQHIK